MLWPVYTAATVALAAAPAVRPILLPFLKHLYRRRFRRRRRFLSPDGRPIDPPSLSLPDTLSPRELIQLGAALDAALSSPAAPEARARLASVLNVDPALLTDEAVSRIAEAAFARTAPGTAQLRTVAVVARSVGCIGVLMTTFQTLSAVRSAIEGFLKAFNAFVPERLRWGAAYYVALNLTAVGPVVFPDESSPVGGWTGVSKRGKGPAVLAAFVGTLSAWTLGAFETQVAGRRARVKHKRLQLENKLPLGAAGKLALRVFGKNLSERELRSARARAEEEVDSMQLGGREWEQDWDALQKDTARRGGMPRLLSPVRYGAMAISVGVPAVWTQSRMLGFLTTAAGFVGFCSFEDAVFRSDKGETGFERWLAGYGPCCALWLVKFLMGMVSKSPSLAEMGKRLRVFDLGSSVFGPVALTGMTMARSDNVRNAETLTLLAVEGAVGIASGSDELVAMSSIGFTLYAAFEICSAAFAWDMYGGVFLCSGAVVLVANIMRDDFIAAKTVEILRKGLLLPSCEADEGQSPSDLFQTAQNE